MSLGGGTETKTTTTLPDAQTQRFQEQFRRAARERFQGMQQTPETLQDFLNLSRGLTQSLDFGQQRGLLGIEQFFNPFQQEVIGGLQSDFDRQRALASQRAADVATRAGGLGGSRGAVLEANMLGDVGRTEALTLAGLRQQGFQTAAQQLLGERARAGQLGLAGLQGLLGGQQALDARQVAALQQFLAGAGLGGQTITQEQELQGNGLLGTLGTIASIASLIPGPQQPFVAGGAAALKAAPDFVTT